MSARGGAERDRKAVFNNRAIHRKRSRGAAAVGVAKGCRRTAAEGGPDGGIDFAM